MKAIYDHFRSQWPILEEQLLKWVRKTPKKQRCIEEQLEFFTYTER